MEAVPSLEGGAPKGGGHGVRRFGSAAGRVGRREGAAQPAEQAAAERVVVGAVEHGHHGLRAPGAVPEVVVGEFEDGLPPLRAGGRLRDQFEIAAGGVVVPGVPGGRGGPHHDLGRPVGVLRDGGGAQMAGDAFRRGVVLVEVQSGGEVGGVPRHLCHGLAERPGEQRVAQHRLLGVRDQTGTDQQVESVERLHQPEAADLCQQGRVGAADHRERLGQPHRMGVRPGDAAEEDLRGDGNGRVVEFGGVGEPVGAAQLGAQLGQQEGVAAGQPVAGCGELGSGAVSGPGVEQFARLPG